MSGKKKNMREMEGNIFGMHELKTIEIDVEKKIFRINGEEFGKHCGKFSIYCDTEPRGDGSKTVFEACAYIDTRADFATFDFNGGKTGEGSGKREVQNGWA